MVFIFYEKNYFYIFFFTDPKKLFKKTRNLNVQHNKIKSHSQSGKYLSANYSIFKGDVFTANKILKSGENNLTLLELQFFSNLVSGNFEIANNISNLMNIKDKIIFYIEYLNLQ